MKKIIWSIVITWFVIYGICPIFTPTYDHEDTSHEKGSTINIDLDHGRSTTLRIFNPVDADVVIIQGDRRWALEDLDEVHVFVHWSERSQDTEVNLSFSPEHCRLRGDLQVEGNFTAPIRKMTLTPNSLWAKLKRLLSPTD